jgi:hypothetical protein
MSDSNETMSSTVDLWTEEQEKVVKSWGEEANSYAWLHHRCGQWFDWWDRLITIPAIILPIVVGSSLFTEYTNIFAVKMTYACLLIITSVITALQTYLAWSKRAACHTEGSIQYRFFADDIQAELAMPRSSRTHGFFMKAREKRKTLLTSYPAIITRYEQLYKKKFGNLPIAKPIVVDTIPEIQINTDNSANPTTTYPASLPTDLIKKENADPYIQYQIERSIANGLIN